MKILKRLFACSTVIAMVTAGGISAGATPTADVYTDNFNSLAVTADYFTNYPNAAVDNDGDSTTDAVTQTSDVFVADGKGQKAYKIVNETGADGSKSNMLELRSATGDQVILKPKGISVEAGKIIQFSYNIYFKSIPTDAAAYSGTNMMMLARSGSGTLVMRINEGKPELYASSVGKSCVLEENKWYRMIAVIAADGKFTYSFHNAVTGEKLLENTSTGKTFSSGNSDFVAMQLYTAASTGSGINCLIDDAVLCKYDPALNEASVTGANITDGASKVLRNQAFTFIFDQKVSGNLVLKKGGETVADTTTTPNAFGDTLTLSSGSLLDKNTVYTISFENVVNDSNLPCTQSSISFTTESMHLWKDIGIGSVTADTADTAKTAITFNLSDEYGYPTFSGGIMAMLYRGDKMIGIDMVLLTNQDVKAAVTKSFSIGGQINSGDTLKLMMMNTDGGFIPLAGGSLTIE